MTITRRSSLLLGTAAALTLAVVPSSASAADAPTIVASGVAQVKPTPVDRNSEKSIRAAVEAAEEKALPKAVAEARRHASELAGAASLRLGGLLSISDAQQQGYPFGYSPQYGTFGPGRFCGLQRRTRIVPSPDGTRRAVRGKAHRVCRVPAAITASVTITFAVAR